MIKLAIDLGSSETKICYPAEGSGVVLAEASCVAVDSYTHEVKAVGKEAKLLIGRTAENTDIIFPVCEGEIVVEWAAVEMLKYFLRKLAIRPSPFRRVAALFALPYACGEEQKQQYKSVARECGISKIYFVEAPYLAALGAGATLAPAEPVFVIDIGGSVTDIAVLSTDGILSGGTVTVGGNNIDARIIGRIAEHKGLNIGLYSAENVKNRIGSLSANTRGSVVVEGSSAENFLPASASLQAGEIFDCVRDYIDMILSFAQSFLSRLSAEVAAAVKKNGVFLTGGCSRIAGISDYVRNALDMNVYLCEEPQFAVATGASLVLGKRELFSSLVEDASAL